eukprot:2164534-Pyramimonas_sp.AAC.1
MKGFGRSSLNNEKAFQSDGAPADAGGEGNFEPIPFEQLSKKDQLEQEFWKKMAAQDYTFPACARGPTPSRAASREN